MLLFYEDKPDTDMEGEARMSMHRDIAVSGSLDSLEQYSSHAFIPVPQSSPASCDGSLKVENASSWTYCGPLLSAQSKNLPPSFHIWAAGTLSQPLILLERLLPLLRFLQAFLTAAGARHYWLTIRATRPNNDYDTPRWHTDEDFFAATSEANGLDFGSSNKSKCWKLATTLLGPPTLFLKNNAKALRRLQQTKMNQRFQMGDHTCTSIRCLGCATYTDTVRQSLADSLAEEEVEMFSSGEVAFFRTGADRGAVHSEPKCDTDRIFVNIIPGTEDDLKRLMNRFGMTYPRAWCLGNPVGFIPSDEAESLAPLS
ncbi:hypothetical protein ACN47E_009661 [Coniothyrium glycines]